MLIELEKEKHREEIKLAIGSQQEETKAISEDCCHLFNTERCEGRRKNISFDTCLMTHRFCHYRYDYNYGYVSVFPDTSQGDDSLHSVRAAEAMV